MTGRWVSLLIAALTLLTAAPASPALLGDSAAQTQEIGPFTKDGAMPHVVKLARHVGVRVRGTTGERKAARYVAAEFRSMGYSVNVQKYPVDGRTSRNVVAWWPGARRYPVVIGAHMDTVAGSPGANDNASGVAVVLEVARIVAGTPKAEFVRFVAFGSEEYGTNGLHHVGSQVFVDRLKEKGRDRLAGMISVDMIADGRPLIVATAGIGPPKIADRFAAIARARDIGVDRQTTCDCSDNGPFERAGITAAFRWSGSEPNYHDDSDKVKNMKPDDLVRTGRAVRYFVKQLDAGMLRRLRRA
ncbi:MAG TPA: M28 family peptidase [Actinomycetota bacterium]|nr:M28 family peptidase [Actinomycetota bacterium]